MLVFIISHMCLLHFLPTAMDSSFVHYSSHILCLLLLFLSSLAFVYCYCSQHEPPPLFLCIYCYVIKGTGIDYFGDKIFTCITFKKNQKSKITHPIFHHKNQKNYMHHLKKNPKSFIHLGKYEIILHNRYSLP